MGGCLESNVCKVSPQFEDAPVRNVSDGRPITDTRLFQIKIRRASCSGCAAFVAVMQATDFRNRDDFADRLYGSWIRRILV